MAVHPVVLASGMLSATMVLCTFGPRLLPESPAAGAAPARQECTETTDIFSVPTDDLEQLGYESPYAAFQQEVLAPALEAGATFTVVDFEVTPERGRVYFVYSTTC
jgi:hypothetical protein